MKYDFRISEIENNSQFYLGPYGLWIFVIYHDKKQSVLLKFIDHRRGYERLGVFDRIIPPREVEGILNAYGLIIPALQKTKKRRLPWQRK